MSPVESSGAAATRGSPHNSAHSTFSARSGAQKAQSIQSTQTAAAVAPVETASAIIQAQATAKSRMKVETPSPEHLARKAAQAAPRKSNPSLAKPMTAVLLHELRLQQELANIQEEVETKRA